MQRREFVRLLGATAALPLAAVAQQAGRTYRLGVLLPHPRSHATFPNSHEKTPRHNEIVTTLILAERPFQKSVGSQKLLRIASRYSGCPSARRAVRRARVDPESEQLCDRKSPRDAAWSPTRIQGARASKDRRMPQRRCRQGAGMLPRTRTRCSRSWGRNAVLPFAPNRRCARKPCLDPRRAPDLSGKRSRRQKPNHCGVGSPCNDTLPEAPAPRSPPRAESRSCVVHSWS